MSWPRFLYDQTNMARLSATPEFYAREYHSQNEHYGFHDLIKSYAGLPRDRALPWAMEHAITFDDPAGSLPDLLTRLPILLSVTEGQARLLRGRTRARVEAIGSSYFYFRALADKQFAVAGEPPERRGTLVFPDKSTTDKTTDFDRDRYAETLADLPPEFQPVAVSMAWRDVQRGKHDAFERAGIMTVTSGHPLDPLFLFRQYDLCRHFKYAAANDISTSFCMSVLAGCRFFYLPGGPIEITEGGRTKVHQTEPTLYLPAKQECLAVSSFPPRGDGAAQLALAERYAGKDSVRPPEFFKALAEEGYRMLQAKAPRPVPAALDQVLDRYASWLANGIDADGWAHPKFSLAVPARLGCWGARLHISIPAPEAWTATVQVKIDQMPPVAAPIKSGQWLIDLPCPRRGRSDVEIAFDADVALANDGRRRACRIERIEWLPLGPLLHRRRPRVHAFRNRHRVRRRLQNLIKP